MWATIFDMMRLGWSFFDVFGFVNVAVVVFFVGSLWVVSNVCRRAGMEFFSQEFPVLYGGWYVY